MYTLRILDTGNQQDLEFATKDEAYQVVYADPLPLPEQPTIQPEAPVNFAIFDEDGICFHVIGDTAELIGSTL
jgi:hypothetical protein